MRLGGQFVRSRGISLMLAVACMAMRSVVPYVGAQARVRTLPLRRPAVTRPKDNLAHRAKTVIFDPEPPVSGPTPVIRRDPPPASATPATRTLPQPVAASFSRPLRI